MVLLLRLNRIQNQKITTIRLGPDVGDKRVIKKFVIFRIRKIKGELKIAFLEKLDFYQEFRIIKGKYQWRTIWWE